MNDLSHSENPDDFFPPSSPPSKRPKLSLSDSSPNVVDSEGVPMFDPSLIHHPNSTEWLSLDHVGDYIASRLRLPLDKQTRTKLRSECPRPSLESNITATPDTGCWDGAAEENSLLGAQEPEKKLGAKDRSL
ncbi:hypothetical protein NDU88_002212 [Pleurodeles waltl]|uniref:Uncharacterized protein n=1 Tax=Pleurodeles waltl TaxID=8319 RepID=A0AAV7UWL3_PLEWA|nr:hypothetical protein NDU88_002212 [Pleurodeles waltl]